MPRSLQVAIFVIAGAFLVPGCLWTADVRDADGGTSSPSDVAPDEGVEPTDSTARSDGDDNLPDVPRTSPDGDGGVAHTCVPNRDAGSNACPGSMPHASKSCSGGTCTYTCEEPWSDANGEADDGCETCTGEDRTAYYLDCDGDGAAASPFDARCRAEEPSEPASEVCDDDSPPDAQWLEGYDRDEYDCDDRDDQRFPGFNRNGFDERWRCDGKDNDCDGLVDEPCCDGADNLSGSDPVTTIVDKTGVKHPVLAAAPSSAPDAAEFLAGWVEPVSNDGNDDGHRIRLTYLDKTGERLKEAAFEPRDSTSVEILGLALTVRDDTSTEAMLAWVGRANGDERLASAPFELADGKLEAPSGAEELVDGDSSVVYRNPELIRFNDRYVLGYSKRDTSDPSSKFHVALYAFGTGTPESMVLTRDDNGDPEYGGEVPEAARLDVVKGAERLAISWINNDPNISIESSGYVIIFDNRISRDTSTKLTVGSNRDNPGVIALAGINNKSLISYFSGFVSKKGEWEIKHRKFLFSNDSQDTSNIGSISSKNHLPIITTKTDARGKVLVQAMIGDETRLYLVDEDGIVSNKEVYKNQKVTPLHIRHNKNSNVLGGISSKGGKVYYLGINRMGYFICR